MNSIAEIKPVNLSGTTIFKAVGTFIFLIVAISTPHTCLARSQAVENGVAWLMANQKSSGSWGDPELTEFRDTTVVANVLKMLGKTGSGHGDAVVFVLGAEHGNSGYLARKINVLAREGIDVSLLMGELLGAQNSVEYYSSSPDFPGGGWGAMSGEATDNLDANFSSQNSDGGWGIGMGAASDLFVTARILITLRGCASSFDVADSVARGEAWLKGRRNPDHGFGGGGWGKRI